MIIGNQHFIASNKKKLDIRTSHVPPLGSEVIYQDYYNVDYHAIIVGYRVELFFVDQLLSGKLEEYGIDHLGVTLDIAYKLDTGKWIRVDDVGRQAGKERVSRTWVELR